MKNTDSFNKIFKDKKRVLTVMAHPDDMDLTCGGTVARLISSGKKVRSLVMTNGGKGIKERTDITEKKFAKQRVSEQIEAGLELGIPKKENFNLNIPDGELEATIENTEKVVFHIRQFKPDVVITHNPRHPIIKFSKNYYWVNHRDHRNTGLITIDAMYPYSRDRAFFPQHFKKYNLTHHKVNHLLFSDAYNDPELLYFDVTGFAGKRKKALLQHKGAFSKKDVEELMNEVRVGNKYFEPLGYMEIY